MAVAFLPSSKGQVRLHHQEVDFNLPKHDRCNIRTRVILKANLATQD